MTTPCPSANYNPAIFHPHPKRALALTPDPGGVAHGIKAVDELAHGQYPAAAKDAFLAARNLL